MLSLLLAFSTACSDDDTPTTDQGTADTGGDVATDQPQADGGDATTDTPTEPVGEPPEIQDLIVSIQGEFSSDASLSGGDKTVILPIVATAEFRARLRDDNTAREDLVVDLVAGLDSPTPFAELATCEESPVTPVPPCRKFENGLWKISVDIGPDVVIRLRVDDGEGNVALSPYSLTVPSREEATVDDWERRYYGPGGGENTSVRTDTWDLSISEDGQWDEAQGDSGVETGGTYAFDGDIMEIEERYRRNSDEDDDDLSSIEETLMGTYYVDVAYFAIDPFTRNGDGEGLVGTWVAHTTTSYPADSGDATRDTELTVTLVLGDDESWTETWSGTDDSGSIDRSWSGTYRWQENTDYMNSVGDFLVRNVTEIDGVTQDPAGLRFELHTIRADKLLINPYNRSVDH